MLGLKTVSLTTLLIGVATGPVHSAPAQGTGAPKAPAKRPASTRVAQGAPAKHNAASASATAKPQQSVPQNPDIDLVLVVRAKELRYDKVPDVKVNFSSTAGSINSDVTDRINLPKKLEAGVTYKDVGFTWHVSTSLEEIAKIAGDVLGPAVKTTGPGGTSSPGKGTGSASPETRGAESGASAPPAGNDAGTGAPSAEGAAGSTSSAGGADGGALPTNGNAGDAPAR